MGKKRNVENADRKYLMRAKKTRVKSVKNVHAKKIKKSNYSFLLVAVGIIVLAGFILYQEFFLNGKDFELLECTTLKQTSEGGVDIVIFADSVDIANEYKDYFLGFKPFDENSEKFNFHYIADYKPVCELYRGIALFCYSRGLLRAASSCPFDYAAIVNDEYGEEMRSSTYMNVLSINRKHPLSVFPHEFGHAFLNLAEEYIHSGRVPLDSLNCVENCILFDGKEEGCYAGCSRGDHYRSVENGVMRDLYAESYGSFNEELIAKELEEIPQSRITGRVAHDVADCSRGNNYLVEAVFIKGNIDIIGRSFVDGCAPEVFGAEGEHSISQVFDDGSEIILGKINPGLIYADAPGDRAGVQSIGEPQEYEGSFYLQVPIERGVERLEVEDERGEVVAEVELSKGLDPYFYGVSSSLDAKRKSSDSIRVGKGNNEGDGVSSDSSNVASGGASQSATPSASASASASVSPSASASASASASPSASPSDKGSPSPSGSPIAFDTKKKSFWTRLTGWFAKQIGF